MGVFEHFPYVNFHELNLSWIINKLKELEDVIGSQIVDIVARAGVAANAEAIQDLSDTVDANAVTAHNEASAAQSTANTAVNAAAAAQADATSALTLLGNRLVDVSSHFIVNTTALSIVSSAVRAWYDPFNHSIRLKFILNTSSGFGGIPFINIDDGYRPSQNLTWKGMIDGTPYYGVVYTDGTITQPYGGSVSHIFGIVEYPIDLNRSVLRSLIEEIKSNQNTRENIINNDER